jgi:hypothetical protein
MQNFINSKYYLTFKKYFVINNILIKYHSLKNFKIFYKKLYYN